jgi:hypothetical protein
MTPHPHKLIKIEREGRFSPDLPAARQIQLGNPSNCPPHKVGMCDRAFVGFSIDLPYS